MKAPLQRLLLTAALILPIAPTLAAPAGHQLEARHIRLLKALQSPIAVPAYIPKGCDLDTVTATQSTPGPGGGPGYEIQYVCENGIDFTLRGSSGGFGGPSGDKIETVWNPVFGKISLNLFIVGGQMAVKTPYFYSDWVGKGPLYFSLISGEKDNLQLPVPETRKVLQSLTVLK